jgi:hypothetical protein
MGLPPTSSKLSTDASNITTFNYQFPNFTGTHTGITLALGINSVAGGGTGVASLSANQVLLGGTTSTGPIQTVTGGTSGFLLTSTGPTAAPTWQAFSALTNPMTTTGDMIYSNPGSTPVRLPIGTAGQVLTTISGLPSWTTQSGSSVFANYQSSQVTTNGNTTSATFVTFSNSPAFTFTPTITGTYKVYASITSQQVTSGLGNYRIFNTTGGATLLAESQGVNASPTENSVTIQSNYTLTAGTSYVFDIQGKASSGTIELNGGDGPFYMFAEGVALPGTVPVQFFQASSQVTTDSSSLSSGTFTTFSNSPAFTVSPTNSGTYKVYFSAPFQCANTTFKTRVFNTSGGATLLDESQAGNSTNVTTASDGSIFAQSVYTLTGGNTYVFDIQASVSSGSTILLGSSVCSFYMFCEGISLTGSNLALSAFGSTPNANGLSLVNSVLNMQPASASFPGGVSTTTQTFAGAKSISTGGSITAFNIDSPAFVFDSTNFTLGINNTPSAATFIDGVNSSGATKRLLLTGYGTSSLVGMRTRLARGTSGTPTAVQSGDILGFYNAEGYGTSQFPATATGAVTIIAGETFTNTSNQTYVTINSTPTGAVTSTENFRVASTGNTIGPQSSSTAIHQISGGIQKTTRTVTASTLTIDTTTTDNIIFTDSTSNTITLTLPAATNGRELVIIDKTGKASTNNITITPPGAVTINGVNANYVLSTNYFQTVFRSDGTNWTASTLSTSGNNFLTTGTTYTTPVNITPQTRFKFTLVGGGGGAGGINTAAAAAAGGGGGGSVVIYATGLSPNTGYTIAVGIGGTAGAATPTAGGNGGITTINFLASTYTAGGGTGANDTATSNGGAGGTASNAAGTGVSNIINMVGGGGGCASGVTTNGSGQGGNSLMGWGGSAVIAAGAGTNGVGFGGGGTGGKGAAAAGGAGAGGCIVVEWWN